MFELKLDQWTRWVYHMMHLAVSLETANAPKWNIKWLRTNQWEHSDCSPLVIGSNGPLSWLPMCLESELALQWCIVILFVTTTIQLKCCCVGSYIFLCPMDVLGLFINKLHNILIRLSYYSLIKKYRLNLALSAQVVDVGSFLSWHKIS